MNIAKRQKLRKLGYRIMDTQEFLDLSDEDMGLIDLKISLIKKLRDVRKRSGLTQGQLAKLMRSSQPRVAMIELGSPEVSIDLICRALLAMGVTRGQIGKAISSRRAA